MSPPRECQADASPVPSTRANSSASSGLPLAVHSGDWSFDIEGRDPVPGRRPAADWFVVTPGYFEAMGIRLVAGRLPAADDGAQGSPTLFVNEAVRLSDSVKNDTKQVMIRLPAGKTSRGHLDRMADVLRRSEGTCPVTLVLSMPDGAEAILSLGKAFRVEVSDDVLSGLEKVFGEQVAELR